MGLWEFLGELREGQAEVLTTLMLIVGGGVGVWLGSALYGRRVTDLKGAVEETEAAIESLRDLTAQQLQNVQQQLEATMEQLSRARREITDLSPDAAQDEGPIETDIALRAEPAGDRETFKSLWYDVRGRLRRLASSEDIHGLRRNKYETYNNYQIGVLIDDMLNDGVLSRERAEQFHAAHDLFVWHRNGRPTLTQVDVDRMRQLSVAVGAR